MEKEKIDHQKTVHHILAHSYFVFFLGLILGLLLDLFYPIRIIPQGVIGPLGTTLMILAPLLILWAQQTSRELRDKKEKLTKEHFRRGPYAFIRNPTHLGLTLLVFGFGVLANSVFIILLTVIAFIVSHSIFVKDQEKMLAQSYGEEYLKYKESTRKWF